MKTNYLILLLMVLSTAFVRAQIGLRGAMGAALQDIMMGTFLGNFTGDKINPNAQVNQK